MIGRPEPNEAAPYYSTYINLVSGDNILGAIETQLEEALAFLAGVSEEQSLHRYAPEKWSIRELLSHVNDTEDLLARRMRVTIGIRAARFVFDWVDQTENAFAVRPGVDSRTVGTIEPRKRLLLGMAAVACLRFLIDLRCGFVFVGREADLSLFVIDSDLVHAGLRRNRADSLVHLLAMIVEHAEASAAFDGVTDAVARGECHVFEVLAVDANVLVAKRRKNNGHPADQADGYLEA